MFIDRLTEKIRQKNNPSVVGLDPRLEYIPRHIRERAFEKWGETLVGAAEAITEYNLRLIDAISDVVPAVKPQLACYEQYGAPGILAYCRTAAYAREKGLLVIADGKRNDIGSTAECYSKAFLGKPEYPGETFEADALTVNPYLGIDGIKPFIDRCREHGKGIFILVKTSNSSSGQLQDLRTEAGRPVYEVVAGYVRQWGEELKGKCGYSGVGAVVGATYPEQARTLRELMKDNYILVPGYGAQGGSAEDAAASFNRDGLGALVNSSRSVICAYKSERWKQLYDEKSFDAAARAEVIRMRDELNGAVKKAAGG